MTYEPWQYLLGALAAFLVGFSKTGLPGAGILVVPLMAQVMGARLSLGATLALLLVGDCFAVGLYRRHADWAHLRQVLPWGGGGLLLGGALLWVLGTRPTADLLGPLMGLLILALLGLTLLRERLGDRLQPHSAAGTVLTGVLAGFSTMVSNAAGPLMAIFMTAAGLPKTQLLGTTAWTFLLFNLAKVPVLLLLTLMHAGTPLATGETLTFSVRLLPALALGAMAGRLLVPFVPEQLFSRLVLVLAAVAAVRLLL